MKIQIKRFNGEVIFEHDQECNSWEITLRLALQSNIANFSGADFSEANFRGANFSGANFRGANFSGANFRGANFSGADFRGANFRGANFSGANFRGANFSGADFSGADFSSILGVKFSQCSFDKYGERGRILTALIINKRVVLFCGCFRGSYRELIDYINSRDQQLIRSRKFALEFVVKSLFFK